MAPRHALVRRILAVAPILGDIVRPDHAFAGKGWREHLRVARHAELLELGPVRARKREQHIFFAGGVDHIVEEGAELRSGQLDAGVGDLLHDLLQVKLAGQGGAGVVERFENTALLAEGRLRQHLLGRFGAQHEDAADTVRRILVIDRAVAVGPVDLVELSVADDRDEMVFVPGCSPAGHHQLDLRSDDRPNLGPHVAAARAEHRRVLLGADRCLVGVVVETQLFLAPEDEHRMVRHEHQADDRSKALGPVFRRAQTCSLPVMCADELAHLAASRKEVWRKRFAVPQFWNRAHGPIKCAAHSACRSRPTVITAERGKGCKRKGLSARGSCRSRRRPPGRFHA